MIDIKNVSLQINDKWILKDIDLEIDKNECVALLGPNGAGKSSLMDTITNVLTPTCGNIQIAEKSFRKVKNMIGVVYEYAPLFVYAKVKEIISYICAIHGKNYNSVKHLIDALNFQDIQNQLVNVLSQGERKKVGILIALIANPEVLVLDEPTSGMDPFVRDAIWNIIKQKNRTILFSTHIWEEAEKYSDKIAFMNNGKIIAIDSPESFLSNKYIETKKKITLLKQEKVLPFLHETFYIEDNESYYVYINETEKFLKNLNGNISDYSVTPVGLKDVFLYLEMKNKND